MAQLADQRPSSFGINGLENWKTQACPRISRGGVRFFVELRAADSLWLQWIGLGASGTGGR
jgi:hypothetical protein